MPRPLGTHPAAIALSRALTVGGAGVIVAGALGPWARVTLFKNVDLSLPGVVFAGGGLCFAVAILVLLGARRYPLLCVAGALFVLGWLADARRDVPRRVKHQEIGAQMALSPVNRLLDQFHTGNIEVGGWSVPDKQLLGPGLTWAAWGDGLLLLGGLAGLPGDPLVRWVSARAARRQCRTCAARWPTARDAQFCPQCGTPVPGAIRLCGACGTAAVPTDRHCVACGTALTAYGLAAN